MVNHMQLESLAEANIKSLQDYKFAFAKTPKLMLYAVGEQTPEAVLWLKETEQLVTRNLGQIVTTPSKDTAVLLYDCK